MIKECSGVVLVYSQRIDVRVLKKPYFLVYTCSQLLCRGSHYSGMAYQMCSSDGANFMWLIY